MGRSVGPAEAATAARLATRVARPGGHDSDLAIAATALSQQAGLRTLDAGQPADRRGWEWASTPARSI